MGQVVVIGDEPATVDRLRSGLQAEACEVTGPLDPTDGARQALADDVTLVVLDLMASRRAGLVALMVIRQRKPALPIIVVSSSAEVADRIAAFDAGANDFLAKPFSPGELVARVRAQLRRAAWR
jgi:DNA-binding response OmpR family regulator